MRAHKGHVALYLVFVLVALTLMVVANVSTFLAVRAKNRLMNAGDAAALAVAKMQGELLNAIGRLNVEHLKAALANDEVECERICGEQLRLSFLGPLEGIAIGNEAARQNGAEANNEMYETLARHVAEINSDYAMTPEFYPAPWPGAWTEYAAALASAIGGGLVAGPDNIDFIDANGGHLLMRKNFYQAVAGENWCWFHFNAPNAVTGYESLVDASSIPCGDDDTRGRKCVNSEVYSLGLEMRAGSIVEMLGRDEVLALLGCDEETLDRSRLLKDDSQRWFFYDTESYSSGWREWRELSDGDEAASYVGTVRDEFNVRGCSAVCRVIGQVPSLGLGDESEVGISWNAAAKPFGTVRDINGDVSRVTAWKNFVLPAFESVRLAAVDSVGGTDISSCDAEWALHVREHVPAYLSGGVSALGNCRYCTLLRKWDDESVRRVAEEWLRVNSHNCRVTTGGGQKGSANPPH